MSSFIIVPRLAVNQAGMTMVMDCYRQGQADGVFPIDRQPPNGEEAAVFSLDDDAAIVGFGTWFGLPDGTTAWLDLLYVAPEERRKGHAGAIVSEIAEIAARSGYDALRWGTVAGNQAMAAFARALGANVYAIQFERDIRQ